MQDCDILITIYRKDLTNGRYKFRVYSESIVAFFTVDSMDSIDVLCVKIASESQFARGYSFGMGVVGDFCATTQHIGITDCPSGVG